MADKNQYHSPNEYTKIGVLAIPPGNHRVKIVNVITKTYGDSGKEGFEITLRVSNRRGLLWLYLICDPENEAKFEKRLMSFFCSFGITDHDLANYKNWVGKIGAVNVRHSVDEASGLIKAYVYYFLSGYQSYCLAPFRDVAEYGIEEEAENRILARYIRSFDMHRLWDYYRIILGMKYKDTEHAPYFLSDRNAEKLKCSLKQICVANDRCYRCELDTEHYIDRYVSCPRSCIFGHDINHEELADLLLTHIDRNLPSARKAARMLSRYGYEHALRDMASEFGHEVVLNGNGLLEVYDTEERKEWERTQAEWQKEWEEAFYAEYPKDAFGRPIFDSD